MLSEKFQKWQQAENMARNAARELQAALLRDTIPPDHVFERLRQLRVEAGHALEELMAEYQRASAQACGAARYMADMRLGGRSPRTPSGAD